MTRPEAHADLSVVIVTWNNQRTIADCLASLAEQPSRLALEVLVVDNASADGTLEQVGRFPAVHVLRNDDNLGFARAVTAGVDRSTGDAVLLLNPDTVVHPGSLERLVAHLQTHPRCGAVGPRTVSVDGSVLRSVFPYPGLGVTMLGSLGRPRPPRLHRLRPSTVEALSGAALCLRRAALEDVGGLDTDFFMYGEDMDLCYRLARSGWSVDHVPTATVTHLQGHSANQVPEVTYVRRRIGRLRFLRKHRHPVAAWAYTELVRVMLRVRRLLRSDPGMDHAEVLAQFDRAVRRL